MDLELSIIIVNYETPEETIKCIESIYNTIKIKDYEVIVVDNCSLDNSESFIMSKFPSIKWININYNSGFGRANNIGAKAAMGKYLLFLNSDVFVLDKTIMATIEHIKAHPEIGVLGCKLLNDDRTIQKSVYHYIGDYEEVLSNNLIIDYFYKPKARRIKAVMGAYMIIPREVFEAVRGFDPDFFMYSEELDLCRRIERLGFKIYYLDSVMAIHKHGFSSSNEWKLKQNFLSSALLFLKVRGILGYVFFHILCLMNFVVNFSLLWKMDKNYKRDFLENQKMYFSNYVYYLKIPFLYSKSMGNGKRILKRT